jgi:hypothetical protein
MAKNSPAVPGHHPLLSVSFFLFLWAVVYITYDCPYLCGDYVWAKQKGSMLIHTWILISALALAGCVI